MSSDDERAGVAGSEDDRSRAAASRLDAPQGRFELLRHPHRPSSPLRAWDAADEYLLHTVADDPPAGEGWLIANDSFGGLAVPLAGNRPQTWSDSLLAHRGALANLERNGFDELSVETLPSTADPSATIDVALIKVPRSNALLEDQLRRLRPRLSPSAVIIGAAMVKYLPRSAIDLFDEIIGPTTTSLARKKARLVQARVDPDRTIAPTGYPVTLEVDGGLTVVNHANVFSRERLDVGTRLLLEHLPKVPDGGVAVDLGCGNGVLGTALGRHNPDISLRYVDVSYMAIASAAATHGANGVEARATFDLADGLEHVEAASVDVIVNNPPFHEDRSTGDAVAWQMFTESRTALVSDGELRVVGNRHLGYHAKLERIFGNVDVVASHPKYVVLSSRR